MKEGVAAGLSRGFLHWNGIEELGGAIEDAKEVFEPVTFGEGTHYVDMQVLEPLLGCGELPYPWLNVRGGCRLAGMAALRKSFYLIFHIWPVVKLAYPPGSLFIFWVGKAMKGLHYY